MSRPREPQSRKALTKFIGCGCQPYVLSDTYTKKNPKLLNALEKGFNKHLKLKQTDVKELAIKDIPVAYRAIAVSLNRGINFARLLTLSGVEHKTLLETEKLLKDFRQYIELFEKGE